MGHHRGGTALTVAAISDRLHDGVGLGNSATFFLFAKNNVFYEECGSCSSFVLSKFAVKFQVLALAALVLGVTWMMRKMDDRGRLVFHDPF